MGSGNLMSVQVDSIFGHWSVCDLKSPATPDAQMSIWVGLIQLFSLAWLSWFLVFRTMQSFRMTCFKIWTKMDPIYLGSIWSMPPTAPELSVRLFQWPSQLLLHSWFASLVICGARFAIRNWLFVICGHMRVMWCALAMMIWLHTQWAVELNMSSSLSSFSFWSESIGLHIFLQCYFCTDQLSVKRCWAFPDQLTIRHWKG